MAPPRAPEPAPSTLADRLRAFADRLDQAPGDAPDGVVCEALLDGLALLDRLEAAVSDWASAFDGRTIWTGSGLRSAATWATTRSEWGRGRAAWMFTRARLLRSCPHIAAAWAEGTIGSEKVRMLLGARAVHEDLFAQHEADLVAAIEPLTVAHARIAIARWEALARATRDAERGDGPEPDPTALNTCHVSATLGGRVAGSFDLDPVAGTEVRNAIAAYIDTCFRNGSYRRDDGLSAAQRRAEALAELIRRGTNPNATTRGEPRPSVTVTIDHRTLAGQPATDLADGLARRCETSDGTPIGAATADHLVCRARVTAIERRLHTDGTIEVLGVTDLQRHPNARQHRALAERDQGCIFPGCDAPVDWCDAHHLIPFEIHGPTLLHNLVLLCRHHHHLVHEGGWRLWRASDGSLYLTNLDGQPVTLTQPGHKAQPHQPPPIPPDPPPPYPRRPGFARGPAGPQ